MIIRRDVSKLPRKMNKMNLVVDLSSEESRCVEIISFCQEIESRTICIDCIGINDF